MKYIIKNKFFSLTGSSKVMDENKNLLYYVRGRFLSPTKVKFIEDLEKNKLMRVRNKFIQFFRGKAFIEDPTGKKIAEVTKMFKLKNEYIVSEYEDEIKIEGNFIGWNLDITKNGNRIAHIRRKFDWDDCFELEVFNDSDKLICIALVIAIDNIIDRKQRNASSSSSSSNN